jgi:hypothetical protein
MLHAANPKGSHNSKAQRKPPALFDHEAVLSTPAPPPLQLIIQGDVSVPRRMLETFACDHTFLDTLSTAIAQVQKETSH